MAHIWQGISGALRSGAWLTAARARGYSLILLVICALAIVGWIAVSPGLIDPNGKPIGTDFSNVYAAGTLTRQGKSADARKELEKLLADNEDVVNFSLKPDAEKLLKQLKGG